MIVHAAVQIRVCRRERGVASAQRRGHWGLAAASRAAWEGFPAMIRQCGQRGRANALEAVAVAIAGSAHLTPLLQDQAGAASIQDDLRRRRRGSEQGISIRLHGKQQVGGSEASSDDVMAPTQAQLNRLSRHRHADIYSRSGTRLPGGPSGQGGLERHARDIVSGTARGGVWRRLRR